MPVRAHVDHVSDCDLWIKKSQPPYVPSVAIFGTFRRQISHIRRLAQAEEWLAAGAGMRLAAIAAAECPPWRGRIRRLLSPLRKWSFPAITIRVKRCGRKPAYILWTDRLWSRKVAKRPAPSGRTSAANAAGGACIHDLQRPRREATAVGEAVEVKAASPKETSCSRSSSHKVSRTVRRLCSSVIRPTPASCGWSRNTSGRR